jgi:hypothetical protein
VEDVLAAMEAIIGEITGHQRLGLAARPSK